MICHVLSHGPEIALFNGDIVMQALTKTTSGFDLIIGPLYNDGWENDGISQVEQQCEKCPNEQLELHKLTKKVFAFGMIITKRASVLACRNCCHEARLTSKEKKKLSNKKPSLINQF